MASISFDKKSGRRTIQFKDIDGSRKSIRLGKCDKKSAQAIRTQIEHLASAKANGTAMPLQTSEWLKTIDETLRTRIGKTGLTESRKSAILDEYLEGYIQQRVDAKPLTVKKWLTTRKLLISFLGASRNIRKVTAGDADAFKLHLMGMKKVDGTNKYAPSTLAKHVEISKLFFNAALRDGVCDINPFEGIATSKRTNPDREYFVTHEQIQKCLDATGDPQWKLIIALSRFGGLRTPSEHVRLRWEDILWDQGRVIVHSPKTEHHEGRGSRVVPIFSELRPYLENAWDLAEEGEEFVVTKIRSSESNLRTTFQKIVKRAGLTPWAKLFQNLRASRQTELQEVFPTHVVCAWMGNSPKIAQKHYLQTTEEHFKKAVQNPVQQTSASGRNAPHGAPQEHENTAENTVSSEISEDSSSRGGTRTPTEVPLLGILSPVRLPFRHSANISKSSNGF